MNSITHVYCLFYIAGTFNKYIHLNGDVIGTGGCLMHRHEGQITAITDDTPVMRFLSTEETLEGNDWLCEVMQNVVSTCIIYIYLVLSL